MKQHGFLLVAGGHSGYAQLAINLAVSIKASSRIPVALLYEPNSGVDTYLKTYQKSSPGVIQRLFSHLIKIPRNRLIYGGIKQWGVLKYNLYDLTPFKETFFVDVDSLFFKKEKIEVLFDSFDVNRNVVFQVDAFDDPNVEESYLGWFYYSDIKKMKMFRQDIKKIPRLHSYIFGFRRSEQAEAYFNSVKDLGNRILRNQLPIHIRSWESELLPDEAIFLLAAMMKPNERMLDETKLFKPLYDPYGRPFNMDNDAHIRKNYLGFSLPGPVWASGGIRFYETVNAENYKSVPSASRVNLVFDQTGIVEIFSSLGESWKKFEIERKKSRTQSKKKK